MSHFRKNGYVCKVERDMDEPLEHYILRGIFVSSQKPNTKEEYNKAVIQSRIHVNTKLRHCTYNFQ